VVRVFVLCRHIKPLVRELAASLHEICPV
jgi:hypothetical protein